jgi:pRiA4b ORF-3-like protein
MSPSKPPRRAAPQRVYQLTVELQHIELLIWRMILVPDTLTLPKLDRVV